MLAGDGTRRRYNNTRRPRACLYTLLLGLVVQAVLPFSATRRMIGLI